MTDLKPWCWKLSRDAKGPDWLLLAYVARPSVPLLSQVAAATVLPGYTMFTNDLDDCPEHRQQC